MSATSCNRYDVICAPPLNISVTGINVSPSMNVRYLIPTSYRWTFLTFQVLMMTSKLEEKVDSYNLLEDVQKNWDPREIERESVGIQRILEMDERILNVRKSWKGPGKFIMWKHEHVSLCAFLTFKVVCFYDNISDTMVMMTTTTMMTTTMMMMMTYRHIPTRLFQMIRPQILLWFPTPPFRIQFNFNSI